MGVYKDNYAFFEVEQRAGGGNPEHIRFIQRASGVDVLVLSEDGTETSFELDSNHALNLARGLLVAIAKGSST